MARGTASVRVCRCDTPTLTPSAYVTLWRENSQFSATALRTRSPRQNLSAHLPSARRGEGQTRTLAVLGDQLHSVTQAGEQGLPAGPDMFAHHAFGAVTIFGDDEIEHDMVFTVGLQGPAGLTQ